MTQSAKKKRKLDWHEIVKNETFDALLVPQSLQNLRRGHTVQHVIQEIVRVLQKNLQNENHAEKCQISCNAYKMLYYLNIDCTVKHNEISNLIIAEPTIDRCMMILFFAQDNRWFHLKKLLQKNLNNPGNCLAILDCWSTHKRLVYSEDEIIPAFDALLAILAKYPDLIMYVAQYDNEFPDNFADSLATMVANFQGSDVNMYYWLSLLIAQFDLLEEKNVKKFIVPVIPIYFSSTKLYLAHAALQMVQKLIADAVVDVKSVELLQMIFDCYDSTGTRWADENPIVTLTSDDPIEEFSMELFRKLFQPENRQSVNGIITFAVQSDNVWQFSRGMRAASAISSHHLLKVARNRALEIHHLYKSHIIFLSAWCCAYASNVVCAPSDLFGYLQNCVSQWTSDIVYRIMTLYSYHV